MKSNINPDNITINKCPANTLTPNLNPKLNDLVTFDTNSIITNTGAKAKLQPEGTNIPK
jgi:hypothetical protein